MQSLFTLAAEAAGAAARPTCRTAASAMTVVRFVMTHSATAYTRPRTRQPSPPHRGGGDLVSTPQQRALSCLVIVLMMSLSAGTASAFRQGRLIGKVLDAKGKPIGGVRVTTTSKALPDFKVVTETDGKGVFKVDFEKIDIVYVYEFEKVGYAPLRVEQKWTVPDTDRHDFQMV